MPHIPDLGLKPAAPPADASNRGNARVSQPFVYRLGRGIGWAAVALVLLLCAVLSVAVLTALAHLAWRLIDAVWGVT
jgi:hypothetical protein